MHGNSELIQQLRRTIGTTVVYNGVRCSVMELLEQPLGLVLQALDTRTAIQDTQFGSPHRRVTQVFTVPCLSEENREALHPELLALELNLSLSLD